MKNNSTNHMKSNSTLLQFFHWYYPEDGSLWNHLKAEAPYLEHLGITSVWLPPAYKSSNGANGVGYGPYDLFDLGEFNQKGSVRTKYGTKRQYLAAITKAHAHHIDVIADVVFNHKAGADEIERFPVRRVNPENRNEFTSEVMEIDAFTKFTFPGRNGKYSGFVWDWHCFTGVDRAEDRDETAIFSIQNEFGEGWEDVLDGEFGNYDYLMFDDIESRNQNVRKELKYWGEWYLKTTQVDGFRLDALKHINPEFMADWVKHIQGASKKPLFIVGEFWSTYSKDVLLEYIRRTERRIPLFDVILHMRFHHASRQRNQFDLQTIFDGTLVASDQYMAITMVDNHDTQPLQALESPVDFWFKAHAYAMILLREQGTPCVFYPALYGASYSDNGQDGNQHDVHLAVVPELKTLLPLRRDKAYGLQRDFLDHPNTIGWTREGSDDHPGSGLAVLLSNGAEGFKKMEIGTRHAGKTFKDALGHRQESVIINDEGWGEFYCNEASVSVWTPVP